MPETTETYETPAPTYIQTDKNIFSARLKAFQTNHPDSLIVPVTRHPSSPESSHNSRRTSSRSTESWESATDDAHPLQADIINALFASISSKDTTTVTHLISQGLISPDCPKPNGETPLLASIRVHSAATARALLALGADPNLAGNAAPNYGSCAERTPLMLAAATGQLAIARMLVGDFGAGDAVVGPRGETALRLAAEAGHRDVVRYLPARRGGAWRRVRHSREVVALRRGVVAVGKAVRFLGWDLPRLLVVDIPWEGSRWAWKRRHRVGPWVVRVVRGIPGWLRDTAKGLWKGGKALPRLLWGLIVWISEALPRALGIVWKGLVDGAKRVARAVAFALWRVVSVLHSFFAAVINRLKDIKLRDVRHDLLVAMAELSSHASAVTGYSHCSNCSASSYAYSGRCWKVCGRLSGAGWTS